MAQTVNKSSILFLLRLSADINGVRSGLTRITAKRGNRVHVGKNLLRLAGGLTSGFMYQVFFSLRQGDCHKEKNADFPRELCNV